MKTGTTQLSLIHWQSCLVTWIDPMMLLMIISMIVVVVLIVMACIPYTGKVKFSRIGQK